MTPENEPNEYKGKSTVFYTGKEGGETWAMALVILLAVLLLLT